MTLHVSCQHRSFPLKHHVSAIKWHSDSSSDKVHEGGRGGGWKDGCVKSWAFVTRDHWSHRVPDWHVFFFKPRLTTLCAHYCNYDNKVPLYLKMLSFERKPQRFPTRVLWAFPEPDRSFIQTSTTAVPHKTDISQVWYVTLVNGVWSASSMTIQKVWLFLLFNLEDLPVHPVHF